jgi:hypothetical protein
MDLHLHFGFMSWTLLYSLAKTPPPPPPAFGLVFFIYLFYENNTNFSLSNWLFMKK